MSSLSTPPSPFPRVAIAGSSGRMGQSLLDKLINSSPEEWGLSLGAALDIPQSPWVGQDAGVRMGKTSGVYVTADLSALQSCQVLIDFTRPEGTLVHLEHCLKYRVGMVIGTTGFDTAGQARIKDASRIIPIVHAPNMSLGVNLLLKLVRDAAAYLPDYDAEVVEAHHRLKVDAPSGTALALGEAVAQGRAQQHASHAVYARHGRTGERVPDSIGYAVIRGGDIVGDHTVMLCGAGERLELTHRSSSRHNYARGALVAARFLQQHATGLFDMQDVLGMKSS